MRAHVSDGKHQFNGVIIFTKQFAQREAVIQLRRIFITVAPQVLVH